MTGPNRDILVLKKNAYMSEQALAGLHRLLHSVETPEQFCRSHELVCRNGITQQPRKIIKASRRYALQPFRFLLNKN